MIKNYSVQVNWFVFLVRVTCNVIPIHTLSFVRCVHEI